MFSEENTENVENIRWTATRITFMNREAELAWSLLWQPITMLFIVSTADEKM